jgi:hypothetical protein
VIVLLQNSQKQGFRFEWNAFSRTLRNNIKLVAALVLNRILYGCFHGFESSDISWFSQFAEWFTFAGSNWILGMILLLAVHFILFHHTFIQKGKTLNSIVYGLNQSILLYYWYQQSLSKGKESLFILQGWFIWPVVVCGISLVNILSVLWEGYFDKNEMRDKSFPCYGFLHVLMITSLFLGFQNSFYIYALSIINCLFYSSICPSPHVNESAVTSTKELNKKDEGYFSIMICYLIFLERNIYFLTNHGMNFNSLQVMSYFFHCLSVILTFLFPFFSVIVRIYIVFFFPFHDCRNVLGNEYV